MTAARPVLCVVHHAPCDIGLAGRALRRAGRRHLVRQPNRGCALPEPAALSGAIVFGGTMSANDDHAPAIAAELRWIESALKAGTPLIGVCLGAQMIARVLGAPVAPRPDGRWELGWRAIRPTPEGAAFFGAARAFMQWHGEGFGLPDGAVRLASGDDFPEQAFRYGADVLAVQFHPEVGAARRRLWVRRHADDLRRPGADPAHAQSADDARLRPAAEAWLDGLMRDWARGG